MNSKKLYRPCGMFIFSLLLSSEMWFEVAAEEEGNRGLEIAIQAREAREGFVGEATEMELVLENSSGDKVSRRMSSRVLEVEEDGDQTLITFEWPTDVEGTQLLTWSHRTGDDDQWLYLPSIQRVKRISSRNKAGSFMGSELSYEDLGSQEVEKFTYGFVEEGSSDGRDVYVINRFPVDKLSGYSKQTVWYDKEYMRPTKIEYFDRKGELLKIAIWSEFKKIGEWWREHRMEIENVQTHKSSTILWKKRDLGLIYEAEDFERASLGD